MHCLRSKSLLFKAELKNFKHLATFFIYYPVSLLYIKFKFVYTYKGNFNLLLRDGIKKGKMLSSNTVAE
jgi:hypothetical protein